MANIPQFNDDDLMKLQAMGKLSPTTVDAIKQKQIVPDPVVPEMAPVEEKPPLDPEKFAQASSVNVPDFMRSDDFKKSQEYYNKQREIASAPPVERVDVSQLAVAPKAQSVSPQQPLMPSADGLNKSYGAQQSAVKNMGLAQQEGFDKQAKLYEDMASKQAEYDAELKKVRDERTAYESDFMKKREELVKEVDKAGEINPNRYWDSKSTGAKITASIGIALGAIGAAMQGSGENQALKIIQNAIDRDIDAQKANAGKLQQKLQNNDSIFNLALKKFGDSEAATLAARSEALGRVQLQTSMIANQTQSKQAKAQADLLMAQIGEEKAKTNLALEQTVAKKFVARQATMGPGVEDPNALPEDMQKRAVKMPNGLYKPAISDAAAKTVNEVTIASDQMKNILSKMRALNSPSLPYSEKTALAESLKTEYILAKKNAEQLGVLSQTDRDMVESTLGNPGGWRPGKTEALIKLAEDNMQKKLDSTYSQLVPGYKPIKRYEAPDMRK